MQYSLLKKLSFLISLVVVSQTLEPCREVVYDHYLLALTWPNQYCSQNQCVWDWKMNWDGRSFVIHGLWPASKDLAYLTCLARHNYDPYCNEPYLYDEYQFKSSQMSELLASWPKLSNPRNFWSHEWTRHGNCYMDLIKNKYKSSLSATEIFKSYYLQTIRKFKSLAITLSQSKIATKADFAKILKIDANNFYAICKGDDQLDQIRICYSIQKQPGKQKLIKCPPTRDRMLCKFPIVIK